MYDGPADKRPHQAQTFLWSKRQQIEEGPLRRQRRHELVIRIAKAIVEQIAATSHRVIMNERRQGDIDEPGGGGLSRCAPESENRLCNAVLLPAPHYRGEVSVGVRRQAMAEQEEANPQLLFKITQLVVRYGALERCVASP